MIDLLSQLMLRRDLSAGDATRLAESIIDAATPPEQIAAALALLAAKGETAAELAAFARVLLTRARHPALLRDHDPSTLTDCVGTGGDGSHSLNLSTGSALLAAAAGAKVAKCGSRAVSGRCGAADMLEAIGVIHEGDAEHQDAAAARSLERTGFAFLYAPSYHPAVAALMPLRRRLGIRTIFNLLGPLCNPARPASRVIGAATPAIARALAQAALALQFHRTFVVHGAAGWDEPTPIGPFDLLGVHNGTISARTIDPAQLGLSRCSPSDLQGGDAAYNAAALEAVLLGEDRGPHRDALVLGAGLVLEVAGIAPSLHEGLERASAAIDSGAAAATLATLRAGSTAKVKA